MKKYEKERLIRKYKVTAAERNKYILPENADFEILSKCKQLEKLKLTKEDRFLVKLIKTQLEDDWRKNLINILSRLLKKYK